MITLYDWLQKFYSCYMAILVGIVNGRDPGINKLHGNQPNKSKVTLYKALIHYNIH